MSFEHELRDFKTDFIWRALRREFPAAEISRPAIVEMVRGGRSVEEAYHEIERMLTRRRKGERTWDDRNVSSKGQSIVARIWRFLKNVWG